VPVVGVALGACAGLGAIKVVSSHFSVLVRDQAQVMAAGPHVVLPGLWPVEIDKNELGGLAWCSGASARWCTTKHKTKPMRWQQVHGAF
jgi:acetyl-CoA carboxylase carboxyltransferase component